MTESGEKILIHLRDDEVVLYKRDDIKRWQARYKLSDGKWHRFSTKTANLDRAKAIATETYDRARFLKKEGLPEVTRRFDSVARLAIEEMQTALNAGRGKRNIRRSYLFPAFVSLIH